MIARVLAPYAERIERVALFGSRATGAARANSDIDLVLWGQLDEGDIDRLRTLFDESPLPVSVDLIAYGRDLYPPLRDHIDAAARTILQGTSLSDASSR